jgi:Na+-translocating ferredoxin:NAD+ oxidoreductase RNF subunit RnfB
LNPILIAVLTVTGIGIAAALTLVAASRLMYVPAHEMAEDINEALPGVNCGGCGYAGCHDYALAIARGGGAINLCIPGGEEVSRRISELMGVEFEDVAEMVAAVICHGSYDNTHNKYIYSGIKTCAATNMYHQGRSVCPWGCIGYGDCVAICPYNAISIKNGVAQTDFSRCVGCGACAARCPKSLIKLIPRTSKALVACGNHDKGAVTRRLCKQGCLACGKCVRVCPNGAISIVDSCAAVDFGLCVSCGKCVPECPVGALITARPMRSSAGQ